MHHFVLVVSGHVIENLLFQSKFLAGVHSWVLAMTIQSKLMVRTRSPGQGTLASSGIHRKFDRHDATPWGFITNLITTMIMPMMMMMMMMMSGGASKTLAS